MSAGVGLRPASAGAREGGFAPRSRLRLTDPRAAIGHMPFPDHRTCAEWRHPQHREREMTDEQRERDAVEGSAQLRRAIIKARGV